MTNSGTNGSSDGNGKALMSGGPIDWMVKAILPSLVVICCGWITQANLKVSSLAERVAVTESQVSDMRVDIKAIRATLEKLLDRRP